MTNEELLDAWLRVVTAIRGDRIVTALTYNESIVCSLLAKDAEHGGSGLTATDLCAQTRIQKSQMNRTLKALEAKNYIERTPLAADKRKINIRLNQKAAVDYATQHEEILNAVGAIADQLGPKRAKEVLEALNDLADAARKTFN